MYKEQFEEFLKTNRHLGLGSTPFGEINKTANEFCRCITQQNLEILGESFSRWSNQIKKLSNIRRPEDYLNFQRDTLNENIAAFVENTQSYMHTLMDNLEECTHAYSNVVAKTAKKAQTAQEEIVNNVTTKKKKKKKSKKQD